MNRIDKLLALARQLEQPDRRLFPTVALIRRDASGRYELLFDLWDGVTGSGGKRIAETFTTNEAARRAYSEFLTQYKPRTGCEPVLIDCSGVRG